MITIKGGVTILPNSDNSEFMDKLKTEGGSIKMPFSATNFTSTKTPKGVDMTNITGPKDKVKDVVKEVTVKKPTVKVVTQKKKILNLLKKKK